MCPLNVYMIKQDCPQIVNTEEALRYSSTDTISAFLILNYCTITIEVPLCSIQLKIQECLCSNRCGHVEAVLK